MHRQHLWRQAASRRSPCSDGSYSDLYDVAWLAVSLAAEGATIHLVHVHTGPELPDRVYAAGATALFEEMQDRLRLPKGATVRTHLRDGDPADALMQVVRETQADLIATGTHSKQFLDRLTLGSVAERMLRGAPCSVLVTPDPVAPSAP
jgi:nucleotide-binding universal stress UspA family protein